MKKREREKVNGRLSVTEKTTCGRNPSSDIFCLCLH